MVKGVGRDIAIFNLGMATIGILNSIGRVRYLYPGSMLEKFFLAVWIVIFIVSLVTLIWNYYRRIK